MFQLAPQGYRFPAGHRIKVEVTANDAPYLQPSNLPAVVTVEGLTLVVPVAPPLEAAPEPEPEPEPGPTPEPALEPPPAAALPATT